MSIKQKASNGYILPDGEIMASIGAIVTAVPEGRRPFVVAYPLAESATAILTEKTSITFSLSKWIGNTPPTFGQVVALENIQRFARGWRASSARPVALATSSKQ